MAAQPKQLPLVQTNYLTSERGIYSWLTTVDHKRVAVLYGIASLFFMLIGGLEAMAIRTQLAVPNNTFLSANVYNQMFTMQSADIIHSFWIPRLGGKRDVVPGQINSITYTPDEIGEFFGQCVEFCGDSHANMRLRGFVQSKADFEKWVKHQQSGPVTATTGAAADGAKIFANAPCAICHTVRGLSGFSPQYSGGFKGPDLTHFGSRTTLAGSILENTPENLARWIQNPDKVKPGAQMPALGVQSKDLNDLVAYLESLK